MTILFRPLRVLLTFVTLGSLLPSLSAQDESPAPEPVFDIGAAHARAKPYDFSGRLFDYGALAFGTATLIRRHTLLTAAHVVYDPATGFGTALNFARGLYIRSYLSQSRVIAVDVLSGYQAVAQAESSGETVAASQLDLGYALLADPPIDEDFAPYQIVPEPVPNPNQLTIAYTDENTGAALTNPATGQPYNLSAFGRFVIGYPGPTDDTGAATGFTGRTMAYTVPPTPYIEAAENFYENPDYVAIPGMSGGPIYSVQNNVQTIVAETINGTGLLTTGEDLEGIRSIDAAAKQFLVNAEYSSGLIIGGIISGPTSVARGTTATYTTAPVFLVGLAGTRLETIPTGTSMTSTTGTPTTTPKTIATYDEISLTSNYANVTAPGAPNTTPVPLVNITQTGINTFQVSFSSAIRTGTVVTLQMQEYGVNIPTATPPTGSTVSPAPSTLNVTVH